MFDHHFVASAVRVVSALVVTAVSVGVSAQSTPPIDPKLFGPALPKTLNGYVAKAPEFEAATGGPFPTSVASVRFDSVRANAGEVPASVRFSSEASNLVSMYKSGAKYLREDYRKNDERTFMWGKRRALITQVNTDQYSAEALVADRFVATFFCPKGGFDGCIKLAQEISLEKLEAVK
jgi:hypothetical protein